jgi:hypothetical protein
MKDKEFGRKRWIKKWRKRGLQTQRERERETDSKIRREK